MKKNITVILLLCLTFCIYAQNFSDEELARVDDYRLYSDRGFSFDYSIEEKGNISEMSVYIKDSDISQVIAVYKNPKRLVGRKILVDNNIFWMLDNNMKNPVRISAQQMLVGQASVGDITTISFSKMYNLISKEKIENQYVFILESKNKKSGNYQKVILYTDCLTYKPSKAELFTSNDVILKNIEYTKYETIDDKELLTEFIVVNALNNSKAVVKMNNFSTKTLPDLCFSREGIKTVK